MPTVTVSVADGDASEPANAGAFRLTRRGGDGSAVTVRYALAGSAANGSDYTLLSGSVTIPAAADGAPPVNDTDFSVLDPEGLRVGIQPVYFHEGDFNRDGRVDLAVVSHAANPGLLSVHLGDGTGGFASPTYYSTEGTAPRSLEVADLNGDDRLDIAVANHNSNDIAVFLGHGDGTFDPPVLTGPVDANPRKIFAEDFNRDGHLDLVTANFAGRSVSLLLGEGNGRFGAAAHFPTSPAGSTSAPRAMVVRDFNRDGRLDVAVSSTEGANISLLLGNGAGAFGAPLAIAWGINNDYSLSIASDDFNHDGHPDLATVNYFGRTITILLGDGTGAFGTPRHLPLEGSLFEPRYVTTGDFNKDGHADLAVADGKDVRVGIVLGDGTGNFGHREDFYLLPPGTLEFALFNASLLAADFNGDGRLDLAAVRDVQSFALLINQTPIAGVPDSVQSVVVDVIDDPQREDGENVVLTVLADASYEVGPAASASFSIRDDDRGAALSEGLVARWALDESSGATAADDSGHGYHGILCGNPLWAAGNLRGGLRMDGSGDYVEAGLGPAIVGTGGFAVAAWVKTSAAAGQVIIQQRSALEYNGEYMLHLTPTGNVRFWTFGGSAFGPTAQSSRRVNDGQWHHLVGVREPDGTTKIYIDGVLDGRANGVPRPLVPISVYLGADPRAKGQYLQGTLDDVRIYQRPLDAREALDLYHDIPAGPPLAAQPDFYQTPEATAFSVAAPGVLANDLGTGWTVATMAAYSTLGIAVTGAADGSFQYAAAGRFEHLAQGETVADTFTYTLAGGPAAGSGTVTVQVIGTNDSPVVHDRTASTDEATAISLNVLADAFDADTSDVLTVSSLDSATTLGKVGLRTDGTITYDPAGRFQSLGAGQSATDSFRYTVADNHGGTASAVVTVTIHGTDDSPLPIAGLVAHWSLDERSGTTAADSSGHGYLGTLGGNPVWTTGNLGGSLKFSGSGDYIDAGLGPSIVGTGPFTVAAWVRSSLKANQVIVQQRSAQEYNGEYVLHLTPSGQARFWTFGGSAFGPAAVSARTVGDGQWHHVVGVRETNGTTRIFIDGVLDATATGAPRPLVPIKVYLGADMRTPGQFLQGSLDEVRIYQRALDAAEILTLASSQSGAARTAGSGSLELALAASTPVAAATPTVPNRLAPAANRSAPGTTSGPAGWGWRPIGLREPPGGAALAPPLGDPFPADAAFQDPAFVARLEGTAVGSRAELLEGLLDELMAGVRTGIRNR